MNSTLKITVSNLSTQKEKSNRMLPGFFPVITLAILLFSSCTKDKATPEQPGMTLACKSKPRMIVYGRDSLVITYNTQDKPITITTTQYNNPSGPTVPPVITVYTIAYNSTGKAGKVTKSVNNQTALYYEIEYNPNGQLIKQSRFNAQGVLTASTIAQYDNSNMLAKITTHTEGSPEDVISIYQYANGNLIKKSVENLYDLDSQEFYDADYSYTYFPDNENKITSYFEGPLGLLFISEITDKPSLQYHSGKADYQLFFAQETASEKKMLKNIEVISHRYNTQDTTNINYSYDYDTDGFPTVQKGTHQNITRRYVPTPFGGLVLLVTPHDNSFVRTMNFYCN